MKETKTVESHNVFVTVHNTLVHRIDIDKSKTARIENAKTLARKRIVTELYIVKFYDAHNVYRFAEFFTVLSDAQHYASTYVA